MTSPEKCKLLRKRRRYARMAAGELLLLPQSAVKAWKRARFDPSQVKLVFNGVEIASDLSDITIEGAP